MLSSAPRTSPQAVSERAAVGWDSLDSPTYRLDLRDPRPIRIEKRPGQMLSRIEAFACVHASSVSVPA
jgi:hypothetical protein